MNARTIAAAAVGRVRYFQTLAGEVAERQMAAVPFCSAVCRYLQRRHARDSKLELADRPVIATQQCAVLESLLSYGEERRLHPFLLS